MPKVAVIYMGGTFGCVGSPLSPMAHCQFLPKLQEIIHPYLENFGCYPAPDIIDSSACTAKTWLRLIQFIQQLQKTKHVQKFIIIHGTDTLSYASAVLSKFLAQSCTVILTGSQDPLLNIEGTEIRAQSDALNNLRHAIDHLTQIPTTGVHLSFDGQLYHGHSVIKYHTTALDAFRGVSSHQSISTPQTSYIVTDADIKRARALSLINLMLQPAEQEQLSNILNLILSQAPDFLILQGFGTGNIATTPQIVEQLKKLEQQGCLTILTTQVTCGSIDQRYAISQWVKDANIIVSDGIGHADLYAKILKLYLTYQHISQYRQYWADAT